MSSKALVSIVAGNNKIYVNSVEAIPAVFAQMCILSPLGTSAQKSGYMNAGVENSGAPDLQARTDGRDVRNYSTDTSLAELRMPLSQIELRFQEKIACCEKKIEDLERSIIPKLTQALDAWAPSSGIIRQSDLEEWNSGNRAEIHWLSGIVERLETLVPGKENAKRANDKMQVPNLKCSQDGLMDGDFVQIQGLAHQQELNGRTGYIVSWVSPRNRWEVAIEGNDIELFKSENLHRLTHDEALFGDEGREKRR
jgi:hypothetical protein